MEWLMGSPVVIVVAGIAALSVLGTVAWIARRHRRRPRKTRTCRDCNGTGRIFTGVRTGTAQRGAYHVCRICKGSGFVGG